MERGLSPAEVLPVLSGGAAPTGDLPKSVPKNVRAFRYCPATFGCLSAHGWVVVVMVEVACECEWVCVCMDAAGKCKNRHGMKHAIIDIMFSGAVKRARYV